MLNLDAKTLGLKDAVLLCFFLLGVETIMSIVFTLFGLGSSELIYRLVFLAVVIALILRSGRDEMWEILAWKPIPLSLFFAITILFFGFEVINSEILNLFSMILPIPEGRRSGGYGNIFMVLLLVSILPAFTEELFFRGVLLKRLLKKYSVKKAIVLGSLLFGMMHLNPWQFVHTFMLALLIGWIYYRFEMIWLCMFIHFYNNVLATFVVFPNIVVPNPTGYDTRYLHPLWFDVLGIMLFGVGLALTLLMGRSYSLPDPDGG